MRASFLSAICSGIIFTYIYPQIPGIWINPASNYSLSQKEKTEQKFNCRITYGQTGLTGGNFINSIIANVLAGVKNPDIIQMQNTLAFPTMTNAKALLAIDDILGSDEDWDNHPFKSGTMWLGKCYGLKDTFGDKGWFAEGVLYNRELLSKEGLPDLKQYLKNGQWTWGTMLDIAIMATHDFNGDGIIDQWGLDRDSPEQLWENLLHSNGLTSIQEVNGRLTIDLTSPRIMRTLQYIVDIYTVYKVIDPLGGNVGTPTSNFTLGKSVMKIARPTGGGWDTKYGVTTMPVGPDTNTPIYGSYASNFFSFPSNIDNAEETVKVMRYYFTSYDDPQLWYESYPVSNGFLNKDDLDLIYEYGKYVTFTNERNTGIYAVRSKILGIVNKLSTGSITVGTATAEINVGLQAILDSCIVY